MHFSGIASKAQTGVHDPKALVAIESKQWVDEKGRTKKAAGFAKVVQSRETTIFAQRFLDQALDTDDYAVVHTDGAGAYKGIKNHEVFQQTMNKAPMALDTWCWRSSHKSKMLVLVATFEHLNPGFGAQGFFPFDSDELFFAVRGQLN